MCVAMGEESFSQSTRNCQFRLFVKMYTQPKISMFTVIYIDFFTISFYNFTGHVEGKKFIPQTY